MQDYFPERGLWPGITDKPLLAALLVITPDISSNPIAACICKQNHYFTGSCFFGDSDQLNWVLDKDGKTARAIAKGVDTNGKVYDRLTVWERQ